jgi:hypothetical protein
MNRMHVVSSRPIDGLDPVPCRRVCPLPIIIAHPPATHITRSNPCLLNDRSPLSGQKAGDGMEPMQQPACGTECARAESYCMQINHRRGVLAALAHAASQNEDIDVWIVIVISWHPGRRRRRC